MKKLISILVGVAGLLISSPAVAGECIPASPDSRTVYEDAKVLGQPERFAGLKQMVPSAFRDGSVDMIVFSEYVVKVNEAKDLRLAPGCDSPEEMARLIRVMNFGGATVVSEEALRQRLAMGFIRPETVIMEPRPVVQPIPSEVESEAERAAQAAVEATEEALRATKATEMAVKREHTDAVADRTEVTETINAREHEKRQVRRQLETATDPNQIDQLLKRLKVLDSDIDTLNEWREGLDQRVDDLAGELSEVAGRVTTLQRELETLKLEVAMEGRVNRSQSRHLAAHDEHLAQHGRDIDQLKTAVFGDDSEPGLWNWFWSLIGSWWFLIIAIVIILWAAFKPHHIISQRWRNRHKTIQS